MTVEQFLDWWSDSNPFVVAHTSGSTGTPKTIYLEKSLMLRSAGRTNEFFGITQSSRLHLCLSCDYIAGKMMVVRASRANCHLTVEEPSNDPLSHREFRDGKRITLLAVVPSQLKSLLEHPQRLLKVDNILVGGSAIPKMMQTRLAHIPIPVWESYGMTETASHVALRRVTNNAETPFKLLGDITCSAGEKGNLCLHRNGKTLSTRDVAVIIDEKTFLLRGRLDDVIISGGVKIHPLELESQMEEIIRRYFPGCRFYITSRMDSKWGQAVMLLIEGEGDNELLKSLKADLRFKLAPFFRPKEILFVPHFNSTDSGKIIRKLLF